MIAGRNTNAVHGLEQDRLKVVLCDLESHQYSDGSLFLLLLDSILISVNRIFLKSKVW